MNRIREFASALRRDPEITAHLTTLRDEMRFMARCSRSATLVKTWSSYGLTSQKYLPLTLAPLLEPSLVHAGISVGWHVPPGYLTMPPTMHRDGNRFLMGELIYRAKSYNQQHIVVEEEQLQTFASLAICALSPSAFAQKLDLIVSMPSSRHTNNLPHRIATKMSLASDIPLAPEGALRFRRSTGQSKETHDYWTKRELLDGSMEAETAALTGRSVLIVDDICKYGATFIEAARACREAGATSASVMALSKTYTCQRIPARKLVTANNQFGLSDMASSTITTIERPVATATHQCGFPDDMIEVPFS